MKRNITAEIKSLKEREKKKVSYLYDSRITELEIAYDQISTQRLSPEFYKQVPISLVATMESFFNAMVSKIIDHGEPFLNNVTKFNQTKDVKFDFEIVKAINSRDFTIGNFIAHILSFNNLSDIHSNISTLLQVDFLSGMKNYLPESRFDEKIEAAQTYTNNADNIIKSVIKTFELRHIFCHEFAYDYKINETEIKECLDHTKVFLKQADNFINSILNPNAKETQTEMNIQSYEEFCMLEDELEFLISRTKEAYAKIEMGYDLDLFDKMIDGWKQYRDLRADFDSDNVKGGTIHSLISNSSRSGSTSLMIENLKKELNSLYEF